MKKFLCLVLLVTIIASVVLINPCYAELKSFVNNEKAIDLKLLGLFSGSDKDFELGRAPTRGEGLLMFTKLLSVEKEAKLLGLSHPFKDVPSSAKAQIGYLFNKGFLNSTNSSMLGYDKPLSAQEYIEYILKALGYYDSSAQLQTSDSLEKAVLINLLSRNEADSLKNKTFLRDDLILLSYNALLAKLKDSNTTLLDKLITSDKVVSETIAATLRLYTTDVQNELLGITEFNPATTSLGSVINTSTDLFKILRKNLYLNETDFNIDFSSYSGNLFSDFEATITRAILAVTKATGVENFISSWDYSSTGNVLNIKIKYRYTKNVFLEKKQQNTDVINKARHTLNGIIKSGMSIYNKELAIHDYIVKNSAYDYTNYIKNTLPDTAYEAYGCLVLGKAGSDGYSKAMKLLCDLAGLECRIVTGKARDTGDWQGHSWNIVKLDGEYYHVDATFDDPVSSKNENNFTHHYFNLSDKELSKQYTWNTADYPACKSTLYNYYTVNKLVVKNITEFKDYTTKSFNKKVSQFEIKILNYSPASYPNISSIIKKCGKVSSFNYSINEFLGIIKVKDIKYK